MTDNHSNNNHHKDNQAKPHNHSSNSNNEKADSPKSGVTHRIKGALDDRKKDDKKKYEAQIDELTDALKRERADIINIRRRHDEQMANLRDIVKAGVVRELLPAIDNLERALKHIPSDLEDNQYVKGVSGVVKQFEKTLKEIGVEKVKTVGEEFNPKYHEAVHMEYGEGSREVVAEELQAGYVLGDEVIRHAMVKVKTEN